MGCFEPQGIIYNRYHQANGKDAELFRVLVLDASVGIMKKQNKSSDYKTVVVRIPEFLPNFCPMTMQRCTGKLCFVLSQTLPRKRKRADHAGCPATASEPNSGSNG